MTAQTATANGHGNLIIQITGHGNTVLDAARPHLSLRTYTADLWATPATGEKGSAGFTALGQQETDLLSPFTRSFALQARGDLLARLNAWLGGSGFGVQVLTGPGGRGKTRLAVELCAAARQQGWLAGFATGDELTRFRAQNAVADWGWTRPLLVVVDYAAAKAPLIGAWLADLLHHAAMQDAMHPPLRLLLLERQGGRDSAWWRQMLREPMAARLIARDAPVEVPPIADPALRWAIFAEAYAQGRGTAAPDRDAWLDSELGRVSAGGEPLFLGMFGLMAARIGLDAVSGLASDEVALRMADQELARIQKAWAARGGGAHGDVDLPGLLAALATLTEGWTAAQAQAAIARECAALGLGKPAPEPLRAALHAALPAEAGAIAPVVPDILGGALAIRVFAAFPDNGVAAIHRSRAESPDSVTRVVIRACQDFLIRGQRAPLSWLEALRGAATDLTALLELERQLPRETVELREFACEVTKMIESLARNLPGDRGRAIHATILNNLSIRLANLGQRKAAMFTIREAVFINRTLADAQPDAYRPGLAGSLQNLSELLRNVGKHEEALEIGEEALSLYRSLAEADPAFVVPLALSISNLACCLSQLGRHNDALQPNEAALAIRRRLANDRPAAFLPDLASSLNNLAICLSQLGRHEAALPLHEEALALRRNLAAEQPDAFIPDLAMSMMNYAACLSSVGRREAALLLSNEATSTVQSLASRVSDPFLPDLALSLGNLSGVLSDLGEPNAALVAAEEATRISRGLAVAHPDAFLHNLATSLINLSGKLALVRRYGDALAASEEGLKICRDLACEAGRREFLPDVALALNNMAGCLANVGRHEDALMSSREAVAIYRSLAKQYPEAMRPRLAMALTNEAVSASLVGPPASGLQPIGEAIEIYQLLAEAQPDAFPADLSNALLVRGLILREIDPGTAVAPLAQSVSALRDPFLATPGAFARRMKALCIAYLGACEAAGQQSDADLLRPVEEVFARLNAAPPSARTES